ncbi:MAG: glucosaminidase domain-containing protein, partial [Bacteroidota bacterium]
MKKRIFLILFIVLPILAFQQSTSFEQAVLRYIDTYHQIAVEEMNLFRIPASITLAQGIFESSAGMSNLATIAHNHFGIKCHKDWTGEKYIQDDETKNECFRKYDKPEESFRDHSLFLTARDRYKALFLLDISDYQGWA